MSYLLSGQKILRILKPFKDGMLHEFVNIVSTASEKKHINSKVKEFVYTGLIVTDMEPINAAFFKDKFQLDYKQLIEISFIAGYLKVVFPIRQKIKNVEDQRKTRFLEEFSNYQEFFQINKKNFEALQGNSIQGETQEVCLTIDINNRSIKITNPSIFYKVITILNEYYKTFIPYQFKVEKHEVNLEYASAMYELLINKNYIQRDKEKSAAQLMSEYTNYIDRYFENNFYQFNSENLKLNLIGRIFALAELFESEDHFNAFPNSNGSYKNYDDKLHRVFRQYLHRGMEQDTA